jgi:hypothetical protein
VARNVSATSHIKITQAMSGMLTDISVWVVVSIDALHAGLIALA